ncbi:hypothetical protein ACETAC_00420 [Aceticella autotrophica]|uniref:Uncharacterized protein n=1 Tax=Aceticella autotrophica TaxID=2755338 RepID=A0A975AVX6_9THEO|nr:hypothetical protein [Aceticella autotrophica]QSZ27437.1 hypothetical protein ACETAC_00420 [Aceticella autotrophica]
MNFKEEIEKLPYIFKDPIKFDTVKYDKDNNLLCYLYLKNKTFINGHLIKSNLVDVDISETIIL